MIEFNRKNSREVLVTLYGAPMGTLTVNEFDFYVDYSMNWINLNGVSNTVHNEFTRLINEQLYVIG